MPAEPVPRHRARENAGERTTLAGVLDFLRATAVNKVAGLSDEEAFGVPLPSSALTPAGVLKHLTAVECCWFSIDFAGVRRPSPWADGDGNFTVYPGETLAGIVEDYLAECERSRRAIAGHRLTAVARGSGLGFTLRYALVHMIEETARHCGHLDLMRERIDGETGE